MTTRGGILVLEHQRSALQLDHGVAELAAVHGGRASTRPCLRSPAPCILPSIATHSLKTVDRPLLATAHGAPNPTNSARSASHLPRRFRPTLRTGPAARAARERSPRAGLGVHDHLVDLRRGVAHAPLDLAGGAVGLAERPVARHADGEQREQAAGPRRMRTSRGSLPVTSQTISRIARRTWATSAPAAAGPPRRPCASGSMWMWMSASSGTASRIARSTSSATSWASASGTSAAA